MISPAPPTCPRKRLTPSRWALESRPFRLDAAPFLCAISALPPRRGASLLGSGRGRGDAGDPHLRVLLPVTQAPPVAGLVLVVDHVDLGAAGRSQDLGGDLVAADLRRVADDLAVIDQEHGRQRHAGADLTGELIYGQDIGHRCLLPPPAAAPDRI